MRCPSDATLWAYLQAELPAAARAELEPHLGGCRLCGAAIVRVQTSRTLVRAASAVVPSVNWHAVDVRLSAAVSGRVARRLRWMPPGVCAIARAAAGAEVWAVACAVAVLAMVWTVGQSHRGEIAIEAARGASLDGPLEPGSILRAGGTVSTAEGGSALARLPDGSRVLIGPRSRAVFARATRDRIDIELLAGAVAIDAAHVARRPFTVEVGSSRVHVVGTAFRVERAQREVTVAVARGRVRVEVPGGASTFVGAGERLVMGAEPLPAPKPALTPADQQAFAPLGILVDPLPAPGAANASRSADLEPRKGTDDTGKRKRARPSRPPEGSQPGGPQARPPEIARSEPRSSEEEFLAWAEAAVATGGCPHYLTGLADIAEWSQDARARERARILRARCYDALGVRGRANLEYRRYLEEYRFGSFAAEADGALER